ncbi:Pycsar system effector family protein [Sunxiuqinia sp. A32]|uniref:Pycsar system effector family protein n=1 Tax=Sunxiuqinia sp. A32 TaxID=3461496 RepID=UPI0040466393
MKIVPEAILFGVDEYNRHMTKNIQMKSECWNIINETTGMIKYSDTKATVMLSVYGIVITIVYSNASQMYLFLEESWINVSIASLAALFAMTSAYFSFSVINPRFKKGNPESVIYFGNIQKQFSTCDEYYSKLTAVLSDEDEYKKQLNDHIYVNAQIAWAKFSHFSISMKLFGLAFICVVIDLFIYFSTR